MFFQGFNLFWLQNPIPGIPRTSVFKVFNGTTELFSLQGFKQQKSAKTFVLMVLEAQGLCFYSSAGNALDAVAQLYQHHGSSAGRLFPCSVWFGGRAPSKAKKHVFLEIFEVFEGFRRILQVFGGFEKDC